MSRSRLLLRRVPAAFAVVGVVSMAWMGCLLPTTDSNGTSASPGECQSDLQCETTPSCRGYRCVDHKCVENDLADGVDAPDYVTNEPACHRVVCDGHGATRTVVDATNAPKGTSAPCKRASCDAMGNVTYSPDPTNTPPDTPGDCHRDACDTSGDVTKTEDDKDAPAPTTCMSFTCSAGAPVGTPINPQKVCSDEGFTCGAEGKCDTCPTPDAACTDSGPGSRTASSAHDFGGIGRTDSGGRDFCGAVPSGSAEYYTYYDDGTGFLASFDPYFEIRPQVEAKMCVYFDCPSITCPTGWSNATLSSSRGCCLDAPAGVFTGAGIGFCDGARVTIEVTTTAACAGYEVHFHD